MSGFKPAVLVLPLFIYSLPVSSEGRYFVAIIWVLYLEVGVHSVSQKSNPKNFLLPFLQYFHSG